MNKRYYWLKLKDNFFTQPKIKKLRKIAGGDTYTIIYLKLQLLSIKNEGKLYFDGIEETFIEEMALTLDEDVENVRITIMYLLSHGLMEEVTSDEYLLPETVENIGTETAVAERMRKSRKAKKMSQCDKFVTNGDTEIDIEKEKDIDKRDRSIFKDYACGDDKLLTALNEFEKMRKSIKKPLTDYAKKRLISKLDHLSTNNVEKVEILNQSIVHCWQDVYDLKPFKKSQQQVNHDYDEFEV